MLSQPPTALPHRPDDLPIPTDMGGVCCRGSGTSVGETHGKGGTIHDDFNEDRQPSSTGNTLSSALLEDSVLNSGVLVLLTSLSGNRPTFGV